MPEATSIGDGALLTIVGMAVVFISLTILMFLIMGITRVGAARKPALVAPTPEDTAETGIDDGKEMVAAIAVALAQAMGEQARPVRKAPASRPSPWQEYGRSQQMSSREGVRRRR